MIFRLLSTKFDLTIRHFRTVVLHSFSCWLCQIASLLSDASSVLNECMDTFAQPQELKSLLDTQKDLGQLEDIGELLTISISLFTEYY